MQQLVRSHPNDRASVPEAVQRFARVKKPPASESRSPPPTQPPRDPERQSTPLEAGIWAAPEFRMDPQADHPFFGFATSIVIGKRWFFAVADFDTNLTPLQFDEASGRAEVNRFAASGQIRIRAPLTTNLGGYVQAGGGVALFDVRGFSGADFDSNRQRHTTAIAVASLGIVYWAVRQVGFFAEVGASTALDSPAVGLAGAERRHLERPLAGASVGLAISYR
jgi:hypothetical protein